MFRNEPPEKYRDIFYDYLSYTFKKFAENQRGAYYVVHARIKDFDSFPLSDDDKLDELIRIEKTASYYLKNSKYPLVAKNDLNLIKEYIKKYSAKGNN